MAELHFRSQVEVVIGFHTTCVSMGRHGIPYKPGASLVSPICNWFLYRRFSLFPKHLYNQLVYDNGRCCLPFFRNGRKCPKHIFRIGLLKFGIGCNQLSNVRFVSRSRVDIEFGRVGSIVAL